MRFFVFFTITIFCSIQAIGQKITTPKRSVGKVQPIKFTLPNTASTLVNIFGKYTIVKYYSLTKKSAKKRDIETFQNSTIKLDSTQISGQYINTITFSIYEIEKMNKDDYLYRTFNQVITTELTELSNTLSVHKTDLQSFFGIIQLPSGKIAFPYKGGIVVAEVQKK